MTVTYWAKECVRMVMVGYKQTQGWRFGLFFEVEEDWMYKARTLLAEHSFLVNSITLAFAHRNTGGITERSADSRPTTESSSVDR